MKDSVIFQNLTAEDLKLIISDAIEEKFNSLSPLKREPSDYLTRQEVADLLRISLPTLNDYTKKGLIKGCRIGTRLLYARDQIENSLEEIQTIKHRRA